MKGIILVVSIFCFSQSAFALERYWVGGDGNWDLTTTTNWAASSGGTGGQSVPTVNDNVYFDNNSNILTGAFTVTITAAGARCLTITVSGLDGTMTLAGSGALEIRGGLSLPSSAGATFVRSYTGTITFSATGSVNLDMNGNNFNASATNFTGAGIWALQSGFSSGSVTHTNGTINSGNFPITINGSFTSSGNNTRALNLGASTGTFSTGFSLIGSNLALNAGTSNIIVNANDYTHATSGYTFYDFTFGSTASVSTSITGSNNYHKLIFNQRATVGVNTVTISVGNTQTISDSLIVAASAAGAKARMTITSNTIGTPAVLNVANAKVTDVDFRDITNNSTAFSGTRLGNCGGNTNINFPASKTVYLNTPAGGEWSSLLWSSSIGGSTSDANYPLPQDIVLFDNTGLNNGADIRISQFYNLPGFNNGSRTNFMSINTAFSNICFYGSLILPSNISLSQSNSRFISRPGNPNFIFNLTNSTGSIVLDGGGNFSLSSNMPAGFETRALSIAYGKLILNGFKFYLGRLFMSNNTYKEIDWTVSGSEIISTIASASNNLPILYCILENSYFTNNTNGGVKTWRVNGALPSGSSLLITSDAFTEANAPDFIFSNGLSGSTITLIGNFGHLDFTGCSSTIYNWAGNIYKHINLGSTANFTAGTNAWTLAGTSVQNITTNGKTVNWPIVQSGIGGGVKFMDNFTQNVAYSYTWNAGSFDMNGKAISMNAITQNGTDAKSWIGTGGTLTLSAAIPISGLGTKLTSTATGKIRLSASSSKTFSGNGQQYPLLENAGTGAVTITGSNTFDDISTTVLPITLMFEAGSTTKVKNFSIQGTAGNLVTIQSSPNNATHTLMMIGNKIVKGNYFSVENSIAKSTTNTSWYAGIGNSVNAGNNKGWLFRKKSQGLFFKLLSN